MKNSRKNLFALLLPALLTGLCLPDELVAQLVNPEDSLGGLRGAPQVHKFDTRSSALGNANVAEYRGISSINLNPASLSFVRNLQSVQLNVHQNWENNLMLESITFPAYDSPRHRVALQFSNHHSGLEATNFLGSSPLPVPSLVMQQAELAYAYSYENILSVGMFNNISFARNEHAQFWSYFANLGVLYSPSESISYGAAFRGLGRSITYEIHDSGRTILGSQGLRQSLELGATLHFPVDTDRTFMSLSLANEKRFGERGIWYKGGLEIRPYSTLAVRSGILFMPEDGLFIPRFGFGLVQEMLILDYTLSFKDVSNERFHKLGLTIQF